MRSRRYSFDLPLSFDKDLDPTADRVHLSRTAVLQCIVAWWCDHPEFREEFERTISDVFFAE